MEALRPADPQAVGPYRLAGRLGRGPQGVVYLAHRDGDVAAVKLLHARFGGNHRLRARFAHELATAQRVDDPGVARVLGAGMERGAPYIASEYVNGLSLQHVVEAAGARFGPPLTRLAIGVAGALWALHRAGVIHRDLRPGNVLLDAGGPRVIDFGYGSALDSGGVRGVMGGPSFRAPEQVSGGEVGSAVDVWAWGCLVVYAATGRPPFGDGAISEVVERIVTGVPDLGDLDGQLRALVIDCLAKEPRSRPSAQQILLELTGTTAPSARSWPSLSVVRVPAPHSPAPEPIQPYLGLSGVQSAPLRPLLVAASVLIPLVVGAGIVKFGQPGTASDTVITPVAAADSSVQLRGDYRIRALRGGTIEGRPFAEYELDNVSRRTIALVMPGELLLRKGALPVSLAARCAPATDAMCSLPSATVVQERLAGSPEPGLRDGMFTMPPHASYVLRISTVDPVPGDLAQSDLGVFVSQPRFVARPITLPFA
ncbi:serine/threonine-protein kinase [Actinocorallia longicatena]